MTDTDFGPKGGEIPLKYTVVSSMEAEIVDGAQFGEVRQKWGFTPAIYFLICDMGFILVPISQLS